MLRHEFAQQLGGLVSRLRTSTVVEIARGIASGTNAFKALHDVVKEPQDRAKTPAVNVATAAGERAVAAPLADVFRSADAIRELLEMAKLPIISGLLREAITTFIHTFEQYLRTRDRDVGFELAAAANALSEAVLYIGALADDTVSVFALHDDIPEGSETLELTFHPESLEPRDVGERLIAVQDLYDEASRVLGLQSARPIVLLHFETDCWWVKLLGEKSPLELVDGWVRDGCRLLYRRFTPEGRLEAQEIDVEALERNLALRDRMLEAGLDVSGMNEQIEESGRIITTATVRLLRDLHRGIDIDGERLAPEEPTDEMRTLPPTPALRLRPGRIRFRRLEGGGVWHRCENCRRWPAEGYVSREAIPSDPPEPMCKWCARLKKEEDCVEVEE